MESWNGIWRAWSRLIGFLAITVAAAARLKLHHWLGGRDYRRTAVFAQGWARSLIRNLGVELTVHGSPPPGTVMYLANHRSYIDIAAILSQVPCAFLAKKEVGEWPVLGYATKLANTVFVDRECRESRKASREGALHVIRQDLPFAAFPEGTTSREPGTRPFCRGLFEVAAQNDIAVVPVAIHYGDPADAWVDSDPFAGHFLERFRKPRLQVTVSFGPPVLSDDPNGLMAAVHQWIVGSLERDENGTTLVTEPVSGGTADWKSGMAPGMEPGLPAAA